MPVARNFRRAQPVLHRPLARRELLRFSAYALGASGLAACRLSEPPATLPAVPEPGTPPASPAPEPVPTPNPMPPPAGRLVIPPLADTPDANGLLIPQGFTSRVIATANQRVGSSNLLWHTDPDGAATFAAPDGGWVYVSNREFVPGGVNAIRFDATGSISTAYNILPGALSIINCGGGITPWGTFLTGEEHDLG